MQGVLSYEERLQRAREEARSARLKFDSTVKELQFWHARAKELEGRLQMYEGRKGIEDPEIGCSGNQSDARVRDVSSFSTGCEGGVGVDVHVVGDEAQGSEGAQGNIEHSHGTEATEHELDKVDAPTVGGRQWVSGMKLEVLIGKCVKVGATMKV